MFCSTATIVLLFLCRLNALKHIDIRGLDSVDAVKALSAVDAAEALSAVDAAEDLNAVDAAEALNDFDALNDVADGDGHDAAGVGLVSINQSQIENIFGRYFTSSDHKYGANFRADGTFDPNLIPKTEFLFYFHLMFGVLFSIFGLVLLAVLILKVKEYTKRQKLKHMEKPKTANIFVL